jgi:hypothetical protein
MGMGENPVPRSKFFAIFMFATKSTIFKCLHKQKRCQINLTIYHIIIMKLRKHKEKKIIL